MVVFRIMNDVSHQQKKEAILKSLAVAGFIGIIILIAWLSIQLVSVMPGAFSSLASLAEGVSQYQQSLIEENGVVPLTVTSNTNLAEAGDDVQLSWGAAQVAGHYTFSYACAAGLSVTLQDVAGLGAVSCDTTYDVGSDNTLNLTVISDTERYTDLEYTIAFLGTNDTEPRAAGTASLTVVNGEIGDRLGVTDEEEAEEAPAAEETVTETDTTEPTAPDSTPSAPVVEQEFVYEIPVSDPNGRTDLSVRFLNIGTIVGDTFFTGTIKQNEAGALQLEVRNLGTKTSDEWELEMTLPTGGTFDLDEQAPLKPNERAVVTLGFPTGDEARHTFVVTIDEPTDQNRLNDRFSQPVTFVE